MATQFGTRADVHIKNQIREQEGRGRAGSVHGAETYSMPLQWREGGLGRIVSSFKDTSESLIEGCVHLAAHALRDSIYV